MARAKEKIVLVGGGGHAKVVIDAINKTRNFSIYGILDPQLPKSKSILGVKVIGTDEMLPKIFKKGIRNAFISVGSVNVDGCDIRSKIYDNLEKIGFRFPVIAHPKAVIAEDAKIDGGTFIAAGAVVNPGVKIGKNVIINTSASVDHDCEIEDFAHIAPGARLGGGVKVEAKTHIGMGANVVQGTKIGKRSMIRAGALARGNLSAEGTNL
jgi:UDP-perosamine 4-acetyltransferase